MKKPAVGFAFISAILTFEACKKAPLAPTFGDRNGLEGREDPSDPGTEPKHGSDPEPEPVPMKSEKNYSILDASCEENSDVRGVRQWRRLSNRELKNTTEALFGNVSGVNFDLVSDFPRRELYDVLMVQPNHINDTRLKSIQVFASSLAEKVDIAKALPCYKDGDSCVSKSFLPLAEKAYRRPLTADESKNYVALYKAIAAEKFTAEQTARFMIEALVQAEPFLYRSELGEKQSDGSYRLTHYEVASALSYGITRTLPDDELLGLAKQGKLHDTSVLKAQAKRLIALPSAKVAMKEFGGMWLSSKKIQSQIKEEKKWSDSIRKGFSQEIEDFFGEIFFSEDKVLANILTATTIPSTASETWPYGNKAENNRITFSQKQRLGILGTGGFLASTESDGSPSPVQRGHYVLGRFMCVGFEPPPAIPPMARQPGQTNKDRYRVYEAGACGSCHKTLNQFGFALENFDASGSYISKDANQEIVTDSKLTIDGKTVSVSSPEQMPIAIAKSDQLVECYARHLFRFGYGRMEKVPELMVGETKVPFVSTAISEADRCEIRSIAKAVKDNKGNMRAGLIEAFSNPGFLNRIDSQK